MTNATRLGFRLRIGTGHSAATSNRKTGKRANSHKYHDGTGWVRWTQLAADIDAGFRHFWANRVKTE